MPDSVFYPRPADVSADDVLSREVAGWKSARSRLLGTQHCSPVDLLAEDRGVDVGDMEMIEVGGRQIRICDQPCERYDIRNI